ncbi:hypothetical protein [Ureibacillus acetophenoni]|uniref:Uncharacterized protein n=1 Tax=Ureibacillus acetophenoni TaxID=614649 RepID=A0A285U0P5_9BACL|nr:hypothetical protein [Ureibacillus acetophenoni]SOC35409.1 hypothetical protein SAMN05877842_101413 [Ureibacillus acetophenoni]
MHEYRLKMPTGDIVEFKSSYFLDTVPPVIDTEGLYLVYFTDAQVAINFSLIDEIEIDGEIYEIEFTSRSYN